MTENLLIIAVLWQNLRAVVFRQLGATWTHVSQVVRCFANKMAVPEKLYYVWSLYII